MPTPTRQQRLAHAEDAARLKIAAEKKALAVIQAQQRTEQRKARDQRRYHLGALVDDAGLADVDEAVLRPLLILLAGVTRAPNPVALLEALLRTVDDDRGRVVDAFSHPTDGVSHAG